MANYFEKTDMVLIFGECHQNSRNAAALYAERYPERYHPPHNYFLRIVINLRENGELPAIANHRRNRRPRVHERNENEELQVLAYIQINPRSSVRNLAREVDVSVKKAQDGAPAHNAIIVREYLNQTFGHKWMGTYGPVQWPPRSPDITPLDYFLWGHLKTVVYANPPINLEDLKNKIIIACSELTEDQIITATQRELLRRMEACVENNGNNFEQFIE
ncbi:uncharacterized protein LOC112593936 [Melanaphis sacchari]|uniref:uncharacterized protein LOC112593936 n=1 Tax=Melanaphis sacchari TaxID=742174 RepID=UPI000DC148A4|nr:uncharacterized protein LOC112593936 [Melanaphis sacchari]